MTPRHGALILALASACTAASGEQPQSSDETSPAERSTPSAQATWVEAATLQRSTTTLELSLPGEVEGSREATIAASQGGFVEAAHVQMGDTVRRGQLLFAVDSSLHKARLKQAKAEQRAAKRELARADKLQGVISSAERDAARDRLDLAFTGTRIAELAASRAAVRAPFDGVLAEVDLERGEVAAPGAPVARLVQLDPIKINLSVADRDVVALKVGTEVQIQTDGNAGHRTGTIVRIGPAADLETRAFTVEVEADNADRALLPGMIARVDIEQAIARDALVIPQSFLVTKREENGVFIIEDEVARWRPLTLGALVRDQVVIEDGLDVGANIVVVGQRGLADGDPLIVSRQGRCCEQGRPVFDRSTP